MGGGGVPGVVTLTPSSTSSRGRNNPAPQEPSPLVEGPLGFLPDISMYRAEKDAAFWWRASRRGVFFYGREMEVWGPFTAVSRLPSSEGPPPYSLRDIGHHLGITIGTVVPFL